MIREITESIEWQGLSTYETKGGKEKEILTGIPSNVFWRLWKAKKPEITALGITLRSGKPEKTGETYIRDGIQHERTRTPWEVIVWVSKRNAELVAAIQEHSLQPF